MKIGLKAIAYEFARRKLLFHKDENWENIKCFGLFRWGDISPYLVGNRGKIKNFKKGYLTTNMHKENKYVWCNPTKEFYDKYITPMFAEVIKNQ